MTHNLRDLINILNVKVCHVRWKSKVILKDFPRIKLILNVVLWI